MIDLETLGSAPDGAIVQIGACAFNLPVNGYAGEVGDPIRIPVSVEDAVEMGMTLDPSTVLWWFERPELFRRITTGAVELLAALAELEGSFKWGNVDGVWSNAPLFDFAILRTAFDLVDCDVPWHYRQERCSRTLFHVAKRGRPVLEIPDREGTHHDAGDDAKFQAQLAVALSRPLLPSS